MRDFIAVIAVTYGISDHASLKAALRVLKGTMQSFPAVDPIPLPAPIWLLKLLHIVTLALHFVAVEMLLGGLLLAVLLSLFRSSPASLVTARAIARRLTIVMTYVINLAVRRSSLPRCSTAARFTPAAC